MISLYPALVSNHSLLSHEVRTILLNFFFQPIHGKETIKPDSRNAMKNYENRMMQPLTRHWVQALCPDL